MSRKGTSLRKIALWMLAVLYIILPTYFSFEISSVFPSFTGSRIVIILSLLILIVISGKLSIPRGGFINAFYAFIILLTVANLTHLNDAATTSIKSIFELILENLLLVLVIYSLINSVKDVNRFIKLMVIASGIVAVFAVIEFLTDYNVFYLLTTTSREVYQASYTRSGMTRAEASFGHSVYYGVYCSCMLPFCLYLYENTRDGKYLVCALANVVGVLVSGSRGQMVAMFATMLFMFLKKRQSLRQKYFVIIVVFALMVGLLIIFVPAAFSYVLENIKSILNIIGFNFELSSNYGVNSTGIDSRLIQLSGFRWLIINNSLLFGLGSNSASRGLVSYYWTTSGWNVVTSVDVGYVGWFLDYGIVGAIGYIILFAKFTVGVARRSNDKDETNLYNAFKWFFICYLLNLLSSTGFEKILWVVIALVISYARVSKIPEFNEQLSNP